MDGDRLDESPRPDLLEGADPSVDWPAAIRRELRLAVLVALPVLGFAPAVILLTGDFLGIPQPAAWWIAIAIALVLATAGVVASVSALRRARPRTNTIVQAVLRLRADPGPALRDEVDDFARRQRSVRWAWPFLCFGAVSFYGQGHWVTPTTAVPGALLLTFFWSAVLINGLRVSAVAGRWLSDPPGPARPMPPGPAWERRRTTRVLLLGAPLVMALGLVVELAVKAVTR